VRGSVDRGGYASRALFALLAVLALALSGCGGGGATDSTPGAPPAAGSTEAAEAKTPGCQEVAQPPPPSVAAGLNSPKHTTDRGDKMTARVKTTCGTFEIALNTLWSPKAVNSFASLARRGMYENLGFDRIARGKMIQGGDPRWTGTNSSGPGYTVRESVPPGFRYTKGIVAMSQRPGEPAGSSRSQFFVVLADELDLPPIYTPIGRVDEGFDVVERIGKLGTASEKPRKPVLIEWIWAKRDTREK
jgi:cyclophilin family peptidyl-prolyl cis-trans isomerase